MTWLVAGSLTHTRAHAQIAGLEHHPTQNGSQTRELVARHVDGLRTRSCFARSTVVLVPEDNLANEAQEIAEHALRDITNVAVVARTPSRYGVRTDQNSRRAYVFRFADLLANDAVRYHAELVSVNPFITNRSLEQRATAARVEFERQLRSFQQVTALAPSLSALPTTVYTGKADHEKRQTSRMKDDMVLAALLGVYWANEAVGGRLRVITLHSRLERSNAPPVASLTRHVEHGGDEFVERERAHIAALHLPQRRPRQPPAARTFAAALEQGVPAATRVRTR
jgi:hypothetical protein